MPNMSLNPFENIVVKKRFELLFLQLNGCMNGIRIPMRIILRTKGIRIPMKIILRIKGIRIPFSELNQVLESN